MTSTRDEDAARSAAAARAGAGAMLPKRFYKEVGVREQPEGFAVVLDGKPVRTPGRKPLAVPVAAIGDTIAAEWSSQVGVIDPSTMPMTRLVNSALDGVVGREAEIAADVAKYAGSDLLCYRAEWPAELIALQQQNWDPVLSWAAEAHHWTFRCSTGVMHVAQDPQTLASLATFLAQYNAFTLAGLHSMTTLMGSALLALAVAEKRMDAAAAWTAAHVDEDFQISKWGEDTEARARRAARWRDMQAADRLVSGSKA